MSTMLSRAPSNSEAPCKQKASNSLSHLRREIDKIDSELAKLLIQRFSIMDRIAEAKDAQDKPVRDPDREREVIKRAEDSCHKSEFRPALIKVFQAIIEESVTLQRTRWEEKQRGQQAPPSFRFKSVCIVGAGLIGGALARRIRQVEKSTGSRTLLKAVDLPEALEECNRSDIFDHCSEQLLDGISECELVVLCAPPTVNCSLLRTIAPQLSPNQVVLDVSSVKQPICEIASQLDLNGAAFVGGHPFFGTEKSGFDNSKDVAVDNRTFCLVAEPANAAVLRLQSWLSSMGLRVVITTAASHDKVVARTSHLIQLMAVMAGSIIHDDLIEENLSELLVLSGGGLATLARLMASPSPLWEQVMFQNSDELETAMSQIESIFSRLREPANAEEFASELRRDFAKANQAQSTLASVMSS